MHGVCTRRYFGPIYLLACQIVVRAGATLSIQPDVTIHATPEDTAGRTPAIIVEKGGTIVADGTASAPITFTALNADRTCALADDSDSPRETSQSIRAPHRRSYWELSPTSHTTCVRVCPRSRSSSQTATTDSTSSSGTAARDARGQWGGLILLGNAPTSAPLTSQIEGITGYTYGGTDPLDSSGMLRYVRVWHGGAVIGADNEINGIAFGGVGAGTVVSLCEVAFNANDGFEFFGGTVNVKYLSVLVGGDDSFDSHQGYQGMGQFLFTMMGSQGDHAFEMDSEVSSGVTGNTKDSMPRSHPQFYSYTSLGGGASGRSGEAMHVNDGTGGKFGNAVIAHTTGNGLNFQDCRTISYTSVLPASTVNIGMGAAGTTSSAGYFYFSANNMVSVGGTVYNNGDPTDCTNLNGLVTPVTSAPAFVSVSAATLDYTNLPATFNPLPASGSNMCSALDTPQTDVNAFYDTVTCKGAFASPTDNWLAGVPGSVRDGGSYPSCGRHPLPPIPVSPAGRADLTRLRACVCVCARAYVRGCARSPRPGMGHLRSWYRLDRLWLSFAPLSPGHGATHADAATPVLNTFALSPAHGATHADAGGALEFLHTSALSPGHGATPVASSSQCHPCPWLQRPLPTLRHLHDCWCGCPHRPHDLLFAVYSRLRLHLHQGKPYSHSCQPCTEHASLLRHRLAGGTPRAAASVQG